MQKTIVHTGTGLPLRRSNVDTDQIIPASYLKRITKTGYADGLFAAWRGDPDFVLDRPEHAAASVVVAGPDFGIGSSREHAVWALLDSGFRVVITSRCGDIFRTNAGKSGLLVALVDQAIVEALWDMIDADPTTQLHVDVESKTIVTKDLSTSFELDDYTRWRLLEGLDDVDITLTHEAEIAMYERNRPRFKPVTLT